MGCGCGQNKILQGVVINNSAEVTNIKNNIVEEQIEDMRYINRGQVNDNLCAVSLPELQNLIFKMKVVLENEVHSELLKAKLAVQEWFENYGFKCPDRRQFVEAEKLTDSLYKKYEDNN